MFYICCRKDLQCFISVMLPVEGKSTAFSLTKSKLVGKKYDGEGKNRTASLKR